jgi:hypothetical protein
MQTLTINIQNETLTEKVLWMLEHFKTDGLEISSKENIEDLKLLKSTRNEETVSFENLDVDLSLDMIEHPERFPLQSNT